MKGQKSFGAKLQPSEGVVESGLEGRKPSEGVVERDKEGPKPSEGVVERGLEGRKPSESINERDLSLGPRRCRLKRHGRPRTLGGCRLKGSLEGPLWEGVVCRGLDSRPGPVWAHGRPDTPNGQIWYHIGPY